MCKLVYLALASYRLSRMAALEDGPFDLFSGLRLKIDPKQDTWVGRGIHCPLCVGFWVSLFLFALSSKTNKLDWLINTLAIAGLQTALQKAERY